MQYKFEVRADAGSVYPQVSDIMYTIRNDMLNADFGSARISSPIVIAKPIIETEMELHSEGINNAMEIIRNAYASKYEDVEVKLL